MIARYLLFLATVSFLLGILAGNYFYPAFALSAGAAGAIFVLAFVFRRKKVIFSVAVFAVLFFLGLAYEKSFYVAQRGTLPRYYEFKSKVSAVEGAVVSEVGERRTARFPKRTFILAVRRVCAHGRWRNYEGLVLANLFRRDQAVRYGDVLRLHGKLHRPFAKSPQGRSSYRDYLRRQGIYWIVSVARTNKVEVLSHDQGNRFFALLLSFRERLRGILVQRLNPTEAAIMQTMLLGTVNDAPPFIQNLFRSTGTTHILAISGLHVALMAVLFFLLLKILPVGRRTQYVLTIVFLLGYTILTGSRPSAVRAFLMSSVFLASFLAERESEPLNSLALSAFVILLLNPFYLFDVGFQLSFVCVLGIILIYPLFWRVLGGRNPIRKGFLWGQLQAFTLSLAVWLAVAGFIAYYFNIISPITILANLVAVPLSSLVLFLGTGLLLAGLFVPFLAGMFAACLKAALNVMVYAIYLFAQVPCGYFRLSGAGILAVSLYYGVLILCCLLLQRKCGQRPLSPPEESLGPR